MRADTDVLEGFPPHGQDLMGEQAWSVSHPSEPISEQQSRPRVTAREKDSRIRRRPHRRYRDPEEMWRWHWARMRVMLAWTFTGTSCGVVVTAATVILGEFWP